MADLELPTDVLCWDVLGAAEFRFNEAKLLGHAVGMDVDQLVSAGLVRKSGDKVLMLADGNGDYAKALGLELDATGFGMGLRGKRLAIVADDGVVTGLYVEGPGEFKVSSAEYVLSQL